MSELREITTDALKFWERGRVFYNAVLVGVFVMAIVAAAPSDLMQTLSQIFVPVVILAVVSNVLYSTAYVVDAFIQLSSYREPWRKRRWILLGVGTIFAALVETSVLLEMIPFSGQEPTKHYYVPTAVQTGNG